MLANNGPDGGGAFVVAALIVLAIDRGVNKGPAVRPHRRQIERPRQHESGGLGHREAHQQDREPYARKRVLAGCWGSIEKGMTMRIFTASVIVAALSLGAPASVQAQGTQPGAQTQDPSEQSAVIRSIQVVNIKDLKPEVRSKVEDAVAKTSEDDLRSLRDSIDATPEAVSALKSKGLSSSQVVAVNIANGILTLFAKTA
jgi:hypothetical protein